jgi:hypothetical protein
MRAASTTGLRCSFCGKKPDDPSDLIVGPEVCICALCVGTCTDLLADGETPENEPAFDDADETEPLAGEPRSTRVFFRLLTEADVARLVKPDDLIDAMEDALRRFSSGEIIQPVRTVLSFGQHEFFGVMPAYVPEPAILGAKLVTVFPGNTAVDLPSHLATILLFSPATGGRSNRMWAWSSSSESRRGRRRGGSRLSGSRHIPLALGSVDPARPARSSSEAE